MAHSSDPLFRVHHALRIKGFATVEHIAALAGLDEDTVSTHLEAIRSAGLSQFREARGLWQLTPVGREAHPAALEADASQPGFRDGIAKPYPGFLKLNEQFKALCGDWQLRDGAPNDHSNTAYDAAVIDRLKTLNVSAQQVTAEFGEVAERFAGYGPRLDSCTHQVLDGAQKMFTGVMCGSYHDVWMELHEDLILTQGIDRHAEGSF